jgi:hypothetical protein
MATYSDVISGLSLFHHLEGDKHGVCAEHDELYAGETPPEDLTEDQRHALEQWGWDWDEQIGSWRRFV